MKFAKVLEQTLVEEEIPDDWVEAAIKYKTLKKCINQVVKELSLLGLGQNTLKLILHNDQSVIEVPQEDANASNPAIAHYSLTKKDNNIISTLKISFDYSNEEYTDDHIHELAQEIKTRIEKLLDDDQELTAAKVVELTDADKLVISPQSSHKVEEADETKSDSPQSKKVNLEICLNLDSKFFSMLNEELESLDAFKKREEDRLMNEVDQVRSLLVTLASPEKYRKGDLYKWREVFRMYLDSEVFFRYNEATSSGSERTADQVKKNLDSFMERAQKSGILTSFRNKKSKLAFNQFAQINTHLLKVLQFQSINSTALRKILKKFDKQTSLGIRNEFPKLISNDHVFMTGASIAQSVCYVIQSSILKLVPQLEDFTCPICLSIAYKPIKLNCGHVFCVRCLVKMKQRSKADCPICRLHNAVLEADGSNLDEKSLVIMKRYFPTEVRMKLKERDQEHYSEFVGQGKCIIM